MDLTEALEWTLLVALAISGVHLVSPRIREWARDHTDLVAPLGMGALAAYIFLHLLPSVGDEEVEFGVEITVLLLVGFVAIYGIEAVLAEQDRHLLRIRVAVSWLYSFIIVFALPAFFETSPLAALIGAVALGLHVLHADNRLAWENAEAFDGWARWVLATAPLAAVAVDAAIGGSSPEWAARLSAFTAGLLLLGLFTDLGEHRRVRDLPWFAVGLLGYGGLVALEELLS